VNLLSAELVKLRTIRTSYVLLIFTALIGGGVAAALVGSGSVDRGDEDPALSLGQGASFATLLVAVIGILIVTNEYRHGTIMTTFLAEPRRVRVLSAKLAASAIAGLVFAVTALVAVAVVAVPWLAARGESLELNGQALEAVGRVVLAFVLTSVIGTAVGTIVQSQVGALVGYFVWIFVVESIVTVLSGLLLTEVGEPDPVSKFLPGSSLGGIVGGEGSEFVLDGGWAALLALGYAAALSVVAALAIARRDP
jgi:ABC-2 type transport system permease protein